MIKQLYVVFLMNSGCSLVARTFLVSLKLLVQTFVLEMEKLGMRPLQLEVTWYKIQHIGEQKNVTILHWEM